jgi:hypothetical protein
MAEALTSEEKHRLRMTTLGVILLFVIGFVIASNWYHVDTEATNACAERRDRSCVACCIAQHAKDGRKGVRTPCECLK